MPEGAIELVVGVLPDRAGVEHDQVGVVRPVRGLHALRLPQTGHPLGVVLVLLAPGVADVIALVRQPVMVTPARCGRPRPTRALLPGADDPWPSADVVRA